ncbi:MULTISPECIES: hypothetical protein [Rhodomicrobium]|nr:MULTISPECIES: hypothetical protein [Rhodomicrobium]
MSTFIRSVLIVTVLLGSVSAASAGPSTWNADQFFDELHKVGA